MTIQELQNHQARVVSGERLQTTIIDLENEIIRLKNIKDFRVVIMEKNILINRLTDYLENQVKIDQIKLRDLIIDYLEQLLADLNNNFEKL